MADEVNYRKPRKIGTEKEIKVQISTWSLRDIETGNVEYEQKYLTVYMYPSGGFFPILVGMN